MNITQAILVLLFTMVFAVAWCCMRVANNGPDKLSTHIPEDTTEAIERNRFLEEMWEDMSEQNDPTIPGSQAWLASRDNDPTNIGSTAWMLAQPLSQDLHTDPHVHDEWMHHHHDYAWPHQHEYRHDDSWGP
ncbi:hypothetical protein C5O75_020965 [Burkholderia cepacia]|uniref:hypothetical protein n=1 Tax=Burkholderia cepacia TaxID=292 RepID=UPI000CF0CC3F|nr:hypothetical protein [Burkholderia cepacia]KAB1589992.1 hypothetical protein C5O75_020965 [Burkholderia cepacia]